MSKTRTFFSIAYEDGFSQAVSTTRDFFASRIKWRLLWLLNGKEWETTKEINGCEMILNFNPDNSFNIERTLMNEEIREPGATKTFEMVLEKLNSKHNKIQVFDIGANIGYFALLEAKILNDADIYAIEAEPTNTQRLQKNIDLNEYNNITVMNIAIGAERDQKKFAVMSSSNVHRMHNIVGKKEHQEVINVEVYPLDQIIAEQCIASDDIMLIRIDIEGYEQKALEGMKSLLKSNRSIYIFIEIHPSDVNMRSILDELEQNGFTPEYVSTDGGDSCEKLEDFQKIENNESNTHVMASRL